MIVAVTDRTGTRRYAFANAVTAIAASLREHQRVAVHDPDTGTERWRLHHAGGAVTVEAPPATLFDPDPPTPSWVARLAEAATALL